jgi:peroxiredoxin Q/BCP
MKRKPNDLVTNISLPSIDGTIFNTDELKGKKYMISFFRFASCPFCNLRIHGLVNRFSEFDNGFTIVAIFDSPLENLQRHAKKHKAPFPILADDTNKYYQEYGVEHSFIGMLKGMFGRFPTLLKAMFLKGYLPLDFKGSWLTMPVDILVDEKGVIKTAHYGKDEGDHLPFEQIKAFSLGS